jgi:hypothetical protein
MKSPDAITSKRPVSSSGTRRTKPVCTHWTRDADSRSATVRAIVADSPETSPRASTNA